MSSSSPTEPIDPYAPPKAIPNDANTTTYLDQDGYTYQNELIANHHFQSPLICAKLGIPIPPETNPQTKHITVKRVLKIQSSTANLISLLSILPLIVFISYAWLDQIMLIIICYIIASSILTRLTTKPYKIPFYFSEQYTHIRKRRIITFSIIALIIIISFSIGVITNQLELCSFAVIAAMSTFIFFKLRSTKFIVTKTKGDFHYIRGVHRGLLNALPHLPLSQ